ncbi:MAG: ATPase, T2SS/T4P/T4SS family, partial [Candidatus Limnocylindria bacterium]
LTRLPRGLVLVGGPTGSGKTTTLAALVNEINLREARHIITIEDPIEYEHTHRRSIVEQIEVGADAPDFPTALRAALRRSRGSPIRFRRSARTPSARSWRCRWRRC